jgi:single-stranded DNA-binding protein
MPCVTPSIGCSSATQPTCRSQSDGHDRYTTEVVLRPYRGELTMLETKGGGKAEVGNHGPEEDVPF